MKKTVFILLLLAFSCGLQAQSIVCDNPDVRDAYKLAINTVDINTRRGILAAGGDYGGEWVRDIAINSWNGVSLVRPELAEKSLWSVTVNKDTVGHQYWDKIIWVVAAYNHYKLTGDFNFLKQAYSCSENTMKQLESSVFDAEYGLFTGPSVFNDGIAGYPEPVFDKSNPSSFVLDHKASHRIKCLSTNCVYYKAYLSLIEMGNLLKEPKSKIADLQRKAELLKASILKHLYAASDNSFYYLIDENGKQHKYQEGLGVSFAIMFGIIDQSSAIKMLSGLKVSKFGITSICPDFERYSPDKPGRHNNIVWPFVNGFFAQAAIAAGDKKIFANEFNNLIHLALDKDKGDYNFREIYNPADGKPHGGWQCDHVWESCRHQTWSATAFLNMMYYGVLGMTIENGSIRFSPFLPENIHKLEIHDIIYRNAHLKISISGNGSQIKSFVVNGKEQTNYAIDYNTKGNLTIEIKM
jgi:glycogen debranching enzyme